MRTTHLRTVLGGALAAVTLLGSTAHATQGVASTTEPVFTINGDDVTITGLTTVRLDDLKQAIDQVHVAKRTGGRAAALATLNALPHSLSLAAGWELTHGSAADDDARPPEDFERGAGTDDEPPADPPRPAQLLNAIESANYTTPSTVCTWHSAHDTRTLKSIIFRSTLYRFNIDVTWMGCDNGTNHGAEPFNASYSIVDDLWECTNDSVFPRKQQDPAGLGLTAFTATGRCAATIDVGKEFTVDHATPKISNTYDWSGTLVQRSGQAR